MGSKKLPNGKFSWDRRVPLAKFVHAYRESLEGGKIMGECKCKHVFRLEIPFGNFGLPFEKSRFHQKLFSVWEDQNRLTVYIPTEISGFFW